MESLSLPIKHLLNLCLFSPDSTRVCVWLERALYNLFILAFPQQKKTLGLLWILGLNGLFPSTPFVVIRIIFELSQVKAFFSTNYLHCKLRLI